MFGLYSNSRAPIATLPNVAHTLSITEDINVADTYLAGKVFSDSITEGFSVADSYSATAQFVGQVSEDVVLAYSSVEGEAYFASIVENFSANDSAAVTQTALFSIIENIQLNDTPIIAAQFSSSLSENFTLGDAASASAAYVLAVTENFLLEDSSSTSSAFLFQAVESLEINDVISYFKYPVDADWEPINTDIYTYSASELMFGAASFAQITFSGYVGGQSIVPPNWEVGSECAFETVPVYTYIPINPEGAIFGSGTFAGFTFGGFSGTYEVITTYETIGPVNTDVVWDPINTDIYTVTGVSVAAVGALPFSGAAISSSSGGTAIVTPNWNDIVNS